MNIVAAGGAAGHWLIWKGGRAGAGCGRVCGRPTWEADHVPTQCSLPPLCANIAGWIAKTHRASTTMAVKMGHRFVDLMRCCSCRLLSFKFSSILFADSVGPRFERERH